MRATLSFCLSARLRQASISLMFIALWFQSTPAQAWLLDEHMDLCKVAYSSACTDVLNELSHCAGNNQSKYDEGDTLDALLATPEQKRFGVAQYLRKITEAVLRESGGGLVDQEKRPIPGWSATDFLVWRQRIITAFEASGIASPEKTADMLLQQAQGTESCANTYLTLSLTACAYEVDGQPSELSAGNETPKNAHFILEERYGLACALAGDFLEKPEDFHSIESFYRIISGLHALQLASENPPHFQPYALLSYRTYHEEALKLLSQTYQIDDISTRTQRFEKALAYQAFADHFLQDGFAAGHMGFNRPATSAAGARLYHNGWNKHGRKVRSLQHEWKTFGDGNLGAHEAFKQRSCKYCKGSKGCKEICSTCYEIWIDHHRNDTLDKLFKGEPNKCTPYWHVQKATFSSVLGFLKSLVGRDHRQDELQGVLSSLPKTALMPSSTVFYIPIVGTWVVEHEQKKPQEKTSTPALHPIESLMHKVRTSSTVLINHTNLVAFGSDSNRQMTALDMALYFDDGEGSVRGPGVAAHVGANYNDGSGFIAGVDYVHRIGFTHRLWTHYILTGATWAPKQSHRTTFHAAYRGLLELGPLLVGFQIGGEQFKSISEGAFTPWGLQMGFQLGWPLAVRGGGFVDTSPSSTFRD